jgi:hypothetical protein
MVIRRLQLAIGELVAHSATKAPTAAVCLIVTLSLVPSLASARTKPVDLRVLTTSGKVLADQRQYTRTVRVKTDPHADCFGSGTGGSGDRVRLRGATAFGAVVDASESTRALLALSTTDAFMDSFGIGVCGIGGYEAGSDRFWYLKVDHKDGSGGSQRLHGGDRVLWYLSRPGFETGNELLLNAPARAKPSEGFSVRVFQISSDGTRTPLAGTTVNGGTAATGADGRTTVSLDASATLRARYAGDIPSNAVRVCISDDAAACPAHHGRRIFGSRRGDHIKGTRGWDAIKARGGPDVVDLRSGGEDRVNCGGGRDRVIERRSDHDNRVAASCERVIRR